MELELVGFGSEACELQLVDSWSVVERLSTSTGIKGKSQGESLGNTICVKETITIGNSEFQIIQQR